MCDVVKVCGMKTICTLRELFVECDLMQVYAILQSKHNNSSFGEVQDPDSLNDCINAYKNVIIQMMMKPYKKVAMPLHISRHKETYGEHEETYYSVSFLNTKYEEPPLGAKPWNGRNPPNGYYNVELNKYNKYFAVLGTDWTSLVNANVIVDESAKKASTEVLIAEILWEITFYGFSEEKTKRFFKDLNKAVKKEKNSISKKRK